MLETQYGWTGVGLEIVKARSEEYNANRSNPCLNVDGTNFDYLDYFEKNNFPKTIDYLQIDIDPAFQSLKALKSLPLDKYRFSVITFEHDLYVDRKNIYIKKEANRILSKFNYVLAVDNVTCENAIFEDWYVDAELYSKLER